MSSSRSLGIWTFRIRCTLFRCEFQAPASRLNTYNFRQTCTACGPILLSMYFWIMSLKRIEYVHRRPLPCSPGTDILSLPLTALRELAIHAYKLRKSWASESPNPVSVRSFRIVDEPIAVLPIEGTRMIIAISRTRLACWNTASGECIGAFDYRPNTEQLGQTFSPFLLPGRCYVGMVFSG